MDKTERELEVAAAFADGQLNVAEGAGPIFGTLVGLVTYQFTESWLLAIGALIGGWVFILLPYERASRAADDAYHKAAGIGRYYQAGSP